MIQGNFYTVKDLCEMLGGISRQRVHALINQYDVQTERVGRALLIPKKEAKKIPEERPNGLHKTR